MLAEQLNPCTLAGSGVTLEFWHRAGEGSMHMQSSVAIASCRRGIVACAAEVEGTRVGLVVLCREWTLGGDICGRKTMMSS
jgi:hypothetical protein